MPYQLNRYNRAPLVTVEDGATDQSATSLTFVGKNFAGYGGIQNENFLYLLENFANGSAPSNPIAGQIWYDSINKKLKFYDPSISDADKWRTTGGSYVSAVSPTTTLNTGDFWFDTTTKQLKAWNGTSFTLVGPQAVSGANQTNLESISVKDTNGNSHAIVKAVADGVVTYLISKDSFTLDSTTNSIAGFTYVNQGITIVNSADGHTTSDYRFWGTASDADRLNNRPAEDYILNNSATFTTLASFPNAGITVGSANDIKIFIDEANSNLGTIKNMVSSTLSFKVTNVGAEREPLKLSNYDVIPGATETYSLGTAVIKWNHIYGKTIHADSFVGAMTGTSSQSDTLLYNSGYRAATDANTPSTIVARNSSGDFAANVITATVTQARYADLAEKYDADDVYDPGTVVVFGGAREITVTNIEEDTRVAGVISTNPAYLMNVESEGLAVALRGKVPCKVIGPVRKGDILVSSTTSGCAMASNSNNPLAASIIGKSLEDKFDSDFGIVMIVVT
jgi:hypothetical protein